MTRTALIFLTLISIYGCNDKELTIDEVYLNLEKNSHDLNLTQWGPYTKKYIGISHIPKIEEGIRFDLSVFPGLYNEKGIAPNVFNKSGFHPWEASPNLEYFSFRHDIKWKDKVYADISYSKIDSYSRAIKMTCVNNTESQQNLVMHFMASIHFPPLQPHKPENRINYNTINLPKNSKWFDALDYQSLNFEIERHRDHLVFDGMMRGEVREHDLVKGSGIGKGFGKRKGDKVIYKVEIPKGLKKGILCIRYKTEKQEDATLKLSGLINQKVKLKASDTYRFLKISLKDIKQDSTQLIIESRSKIPIIIDGFTVVNEQDFNLISIQPIVWNNVPEIIEGPSKNSIILKYENIDQYYGIYWNYPDFSNREWFFKDLPPSINKELDDLNTNKIYGDSLGHYTDVFLKPILLQPYETKSINGIVCTGSKEQVISQLKESDEHDFDTNYRQARENLVTYNTVPEGKKYEFSQKLMATTTLTNVVYPVYTQKQYIRHHSPGRKWDCLYTWDSGFIGIGLSQLSIQRGIENLNVYLNEPYEQSAFIHHGTPLPVQFYQFHELWNKTQSESLVINSYPKLKKYYAFLIGNISSSTTRNLNSGLIRTWDYFYNSGGWDDYPAQKYVHANKLTKNITPTISTAHVIRIAKIMQMAAQQLNLKEDIEIYNNDIKQLAKALQDYAWDEETGYFGYVVHSKSGNPKGILKYKDSINFNMGLGGATPLISGICDNDQTEKIISHLKTKGEIWSNVGLSTVDQRAPYYNKKGYWNGHVWMPHQWFFWKTMLDEGEADFAFKIAKTALDLWKKETENSYNCYEYFSIETEKGKGWHQFSGLSSPVLSWFNAYYQIGNITTGYDVWIKEKEFNKDYTELKSKLEIFNHKEKPFSIIVCLNPEFEYDVFWNDQKINFKQFNKGTLSISIIEKGTIGSLEIRKKSI